MIGDLASLLNMSAEDAARYCVYAPGTEVVTQIADCEIRSLGDPKLCKACGELLKNNPSHEWQGVSAPGPSQRNGALTFAAGQGAARPPG